jgi:L-threonate 2-dehydrogenase
MDTVGVIGLGLMGTALTRRLIGAGFSVLGYDVDEAKRAAIVNFGAKLVESASQIVEKCSAVLIAVFSTDQVEQVIDGNIVGARQDAQESVVICTSTCDPDRLALLASRVEANHISLLEVPISGTSRQVTEGDGVGLIGGERALMDRCTTILDAICPRRYFLGSIGNGSRAKLAVNLILGLNRAAMAEGLVFAECLGLDRAAFLEVARGSAAYSAVMDTKGPMMVTQEFSNPQSRVDQSLKDFDLMLDQAAIKGQLLPFASAYTKLLKDCTQHGEAEWDNAAIVEAISRQRDR